MEKLYSGVICRIFQVAYILVPFCEMEIVESISESYELNKLLYERHLAQCLGHRIPSRKLSLLVRMTVMKVSRSWKDLVL